jgi:4-hydroxybenzoate polyprenyltransferase
MTEAMTETMTGDNARAALDSIERNRRRVIGEFGMPRWYWWGMAVGWIGLAIITDLQHPWLSTVATLAFGAGHAAVYNSLQAGRHRTDQLQVRAELVGRRANLMIIGCLLGLAAVTSIGAILISADGAQHPATIASIPVAVAIVLGGPTLMEALRRHALKRQL